MQLKVKDLTAARFHGEIAMEAAGARRCDVNSRNGTILYGVPVADAF